ncbi:hypothetical protein Z042_22975 [Chania multitudinisentens RB-25]|uniref:Uncharacterized protein n=1 Tax=Chania multitudinisentens RB-25 TaxID=1441930 RepID=W0LJJ1_9GAMM|nr:hypothetical protein [Chania multitudinisentens]AHG22165.1 hypothetical protein Z042_22975 [Chania multitudinisentens RB-25]
MDDELIYGKPYKPEDDFCCHIKPIIYTMRTRASIRSGEPYRPMPKPIYTGTGKPPAKRRVDSVNVGSRQRYSSNIMLCVYQFHRAGHSEQTIASDTGIPVTDIRKMLEHKTQTQRKAWMLAHQLRIPSNQEIFSRLLREI